MIGVIADQAEHDVVREFFELFKTPWQFYREHGNYDVVLSTGSCPIDGAPFVICYSGEKVDYDEAAKARLGAQRRQPCIVSHREYRIPIYGDTITFRENHGVLLEDEESRECVAYVDQSGKQVLARVGYDLFSEIRTLLTVGQPVANAHFPAFELHIAFLRHLITSFGCPLIEIPPLPDKYRFVVCITHDVDHPSIRLHKWDHTTFGFLFRSIFGSLRDVFRRRLSVRNVLMNWIAAVKLPFIHLGLAKDFWSQFTDRYMELEEGLPSTFFVIPRRNYPGKNSQGAAPTFRATRYEARDIAETIQRLQKAGCEIGLHGIDAWCDSSSARRELQEIRCLTGDSEIGVRMHWLYYNQQSGIALEEAGALYDSTVGYNQTVGYRAGTTQVYRPLGASNLFELPLHVMDTALFYSNYLDLAPRQASQRLARLAENVGHFGGCLTINWHDRSLGPERFWGPCYSDFVQELKSRGAWFATAREAVCWFRKRRSVEFQIDPVETATVRPRVAFAQNDNLPGLRLRINRLANRDGSGPALGYVDIPLDEKAEAFIPVEAKA
jgi:peptidoglycan/xylan/chitin deacetylase (PgdA/CDA1 family)